MNEPLDMPQDPDRFVAGADGLRQPAGPLDQSKDPDRFDPTSKTLPELLGKGAQEDDRNNLTWLFGLLAVISFLVLISLLAQLGGGQ